jgi:hypothetical protein
VVSFTLRSLYSRGKSPRYPLSRRLGGPQNHSGRRGEEKSLTPIGTRIPTFGRPARSQSLCRLGTMIAQSVKRQATGWTARVRFPAVQNLSVLHRVQTNSGGPPSVLSNGALSPGVMRQGREADHSPPSSAEVQKGRAIPPVTHTPSWRSLPIKLE